MNIAHGAKPLLLGRVTSQDDIHRLLTTAQCLPIYQRGYPLAQLEMRSLWRCPEAEPRLGATLHLNAKLCVGSPQITHVLGHRHRTLPLTPHRENYGVRL